MYFLSKIHNGISFCQLRMYVYSVNGRSVLSLNHDEIASIVLQGMVVDLVVLHHSRSSGAWGRGAYGLDIIVIAFVIFFTLKKGIFIWNTDFKNKIITLS